MTKDISAQSADSIKEDASDEDLMEEDEDDQNEEMEILNVDPIAPTAPSETSEEGTKAEQSPVQEQEEGKESVHTETTTISAVDTTASEIKDTFNDPLVPQTLTLAPEEQITNKEANDDEEPEAETSSDEEEQSDKQEKKKPELLEEEKQQRELQRKLAIKQYIEEMKAEAKAAEAYMSDECEEEDDDGNVLNYRTLDDIHNLDDKELEKEIESFIEFNESDEESAVQRSEVESEITDITDEEEEEDDEILSVMSFGDDDNNLPSRNRKLVKKEYTPQMLKEHFEKNRELLESMKRQDGGYGPFSARTSRLLNLTLSKFAIPQSAVEDDKKKLDQRKERLELETKKKEAEKRQVEAYRNALKKRKRELLASQEATTSEQDSQSSSVVSPSPSHSLPSLSFSLTNSQEVLSIIQQTPTTSTSQAPPSRPSHNKHAAPKSSFLNNTNRQKAKQFVARQEQKKQKQSKQSISVFSLSSSSTEKPKKKKKTSHKKK